MVSNTESGNLVIQCNCYFPDEWKFDVCPVGTTHPAFQHQSESTSSSSSSNESDIQHIYEVEDNDTNIEFEKEPEPEIEDTGINIESEEETEEPEAIKVLVEKLSGRFDATALIMLNRFIGEFMGYIKSIQDLKSNVAPRKFQDPEQIGFIPKSRKKSTNITPLPERLFKGARQIKSSFLTAISKKARKADFDYNADFYVSEGRRVEEVALHQKFLSICPEVFPKLHEFFSNEEDAELVDLMFEKMDPFIYREGRKTVLSERMMYQFPTEALIRDLKFAIEILHSLDWLHSVIGYVHSDISPNNIMFSIDSGVWKLIDFDAAMESNLSKSSSRISGTDDYIAPESLETGIFTEASDVFSLGRVIEDALYHNLAFEFECRSKKNDWKFALFFRFECVLFKMLKSDPRERISTRDALLEFYDILVKFPIETFHPFDSVYLRVGALHTEAASLEKLQKKMKKASIADIENSSKKHKQEFTEVLFNSICPYVNIQIKN